MTFAIVATFTLLGVAYAFPQVNLQNQTYPGLTQVGGTDNSTNIQVPTITGGNIENPDFQSGFGNQTQVGIDQATGMQGQLQQQQQQMQQCGPNGTIPAVEVPGAQGGIPGAQGGVPGVQGGMPGVQGGMPSYEVPAYQGAIPGQNQTIQGPGFQSPTFQMQNQTLGGVSNRFGNRNKNKNKN